MKKKLYNRSALLVLALLSAGMILNAQDAFKEVTGNYNVKEGATLNCDIRYSDMEILSWDKNVVDVVAEITVDASSKSKAEERLERINVSINQSGSTVSIETELDEGWSRNVKVDIRIIVKAPTHMNLDMETAYGDLYVQELNGLLNLEMKYGNLKAGKLGRGNEKPFSTMELGYSDASIEQAGWLEAELAYSDLEISTSKMLFVESKYSKLSGESSGGIVAEGAYDKYFFDEVGNFVGELKYSGIKFGALTRKLNVEAKYTHVKISHLSSDFKEVYADLSYGNLYLDVEDGASFKLEAETHYGNLSTEVDGKLSKSKENNRVQMWGTVGSSPKGSITAVTRYGNIDIR